MARICFVCLPAYSLFNQTTRYVFGGSELRAWLFATGLAAAHAGHEVSFVVHDHGQSKIEYHGNVKVYRYSPCRSKASMVARFIQKNLIRVQRFPYFTIKQKRIGVFLKGAAVLPLWLFDKLLYFLYQLCFPPLYIDTYKIPQIRIRTYKMVDADLYCTFGVANGSAELAAFCQKYEKPLMLFSGSDNDFSDLHKIRPQGTDYYGSIGFVCNYLIQQANIIIAQTHHQATLLKKHFGRRSHIVSSPISFSGTTNRDLQNIQRKSVLWIGKSDATKQPEIILQLAALFQDQHFVMIMNRTDPTIFERIQTEKPKNVDIIDYVPYPQIEKYFADAFVLVNTSKFEGFPNTFLQAGKYGVPVLSLKVDPDGFIGQHCCGIVANGDFSKLVQGLRILNRDKEQALMFSKNIRRYVRQRHNLYDKVTQLESIIRNFLHEHVQG